MKTYRITYTQASENTVEIEAANVKDAWALVKGGDLSDKRVLWNIVGNVVYKAKLTEEITKHIATNPS
jgi:Icc-related predicted phosphoesterase